MALTVNELAKQIYDVVGGVSNINNVFNCMTRLRLVVNDDKKVDADALKKISGVLSVIISNNSFQVVLGPGKAKKVTDEFIIICEKNGGIGKAQIVEEVKEEEIKEEKTFSGNPFVKFFKRIGYFLVNKVKINKGFKHIGNIFSPLIPGFIAFGIIFSIRCIIIMAAGGGDPNFDPAKLTGAARVFYLFFDILSSGFISILAVLVGVNSAKEFKVTPVIGGILGGITIVPSLIDLSYALGWVTGSNPVHGIVEKGMGGVMAVIFIVFIIGYLERFLRRIVPDVLDNVVTPLIVILVGGALLIFAVMPLFGIITKGITIGINGLTSPNMHIAVKIIVGFLLGACYLPLIMLGLHHGFDAIYTDYLSHDPFTGIPLYPVFTMVDASHAGAGLAIYLKAKKANHTRLKENALAGLFPQILCVSEPLIYGVTLPLVKPFLTVGIGAGIGGAFIMCVGLQSAAFAVSGLLATPMMIYVNGVLNPLKGIMFYLSGWLLSAICGFLATWFLVTNKDLERVPRD